MFIIDATMNMMHLNNVDILTQDAKDAFNNILM